MLFISSVEDCMTFHVFLFLFAFFLLVCCCGFFVYMCSTVDLPTVCGIVPHPT